MTATGKLKVEDQSCPTTWVSRHFHKSLVLPASLSLGMT